MNYIKQLNAFMTLSAGQLKPNAQALYFRLLHFANRAGWEEWFPVTNAMLMLSTNIGHSRTLTAARDELIGTGYIEYRKGSQGKPSQYSIVELGKTTPAQDEKNDEKKKKKEPEKDKEASEDQGGYGVEIQGNNTPKTTPGDDLWCNNTPFSTPYSTPFSTPYCTPYTPCEASNHAASEKAKLKHKHKHKQDRDISPLSPLTETYSAIDDFQNKIRPVKSLVEAEEIKTLCEEFGEQKFKSAVSIAREKGGRSVNYIATILRNDRYKDTKGSANGAGGREAREERQRKLEEKWSLS